MHTRDLRIALRSLLRQPLWTLTVLGTLALGLGATITVFSILHGVILRPLPYEDADQLIAVSRDLARGYETVSFPVYEDLRLRQQVFEDIGVWSSNSRTMVAGGESEQITGAYISANLFQILGVQPLFGEGFVENDDIEGARGALLLSYDYWMTRFAGDVGILGESLLVDERQYIIKGIMPEAFAFPVQGMQFWESLAHAMRGRSIFYLNPIARMLDGYSLSQIKEYINQEEWVIPAAEDQEARVVPLAAMSLHDSLVARSRPVLLFFQLAVLAVLLIACFNVMSLVLIRAAGRTRDFTIRSALGAGSGHLIEQILTETMILGLLGGGTGLLFATPAIRTLLALVPGSIPLQEQIGIDLPVVAVSLLLAIGVGGLIGLVPVLRVIRGRHREGLQVAGRGYTGGLRRVRFMRLLIGTQISITLVLLILSGSLVQNYLGLVSVETGLDVEHVLAVEFQLPQTRYYNPASQQRFYEEFRARLEVIPGIERASTAAFTPFSGSWGDSRITIEGIVEIPENDDYVDIQLVDPGYFETMGIFLPVGRDFDERDSGEGLPVVIVNEVMANRFFPECNPVGHRIRFGSRTSAPWLTIIGVVEEVIHRGLDSPPMNQIYRPFSQNPGGNRRTLLLRSTGEPAQHSTSVQTILNDLDPSLPPPTAVTVGDLIRESVAGQRFQMNVLELFGIIALLLALIGLYGIVDYSVSRRSREIGIRIAVGANPNRVVREILLNYLSVIIGGIIAGLIGAFSLAGLLESKLPNVQTPGPALYVFITMALLSIALMATYFPARHARKIEAVTVLRNE